jgi:hypothetical protein
MKQTIKDIAPFVLLSWVALFLMGYWVTTYSNQAATVGKAIDSFLKLLGA